MRNALNGIRQRIRGDSSPPANNADAAASDPNAAPATMHKGANVIVHLFVEGEDAPAHDFTETAIAGAHAVIAAGQSATPLQVTVKKVEVDDDSPDADR